MLKSLLSYIAPPDKWTFPVIILLAIFIGLGLFVFRISNAPSYFSDEPKTCVNCHIMAPQYSTWGHSAHREVATCNDCHVPHNNFLNKYYFKAKDISRVSHQEMRSLVCAQCHVEYYFDKNISKGMDYLKFPWDKGMIAEKIEEYYDGIEFTDWTHQLSKAPMLKAQHPDYEIYLKGTHASRGVSYADCHMPYINEGGQKFTSHHVTSPLKNISVSCQVCHRQETERLVQDVYERQDKIIENRDELERLLVRAHIEARAAWDNGAKDEQMKDILRDIRHAQWRWDYCAASHGASFHAPVEVGRIISTGIVLAQEARIKLNRLLVSLGQKKEIPYPDISTKSKAQALIGLNIKTLDAEKQEFLKTIIPKWINEAAEREKMYPTGTVDIK